MREGRALPAPKQARSELSTGLLLDAAAELIAEGGYERMTLVAIGQRAGYSPGLVTARFGSKEGLLWVLVENMVEDWQETMLRPAIAGTTGRDAVHAMLETFRASWQRRPARMRALYVLIFEALLPIPTLRERMADLHRDFRTKLREAFDEAIGARTLDQATDTELAARLILGGLRGAIYQAMLDPVEISVDEALTDVGRLADILLPPAPRRPASSRPGS
jgi:AcrR family transcriptional regulator